MRLYSAVRFIYRWADWAVLRHLPGQARLQASLWRLARRLFPTRIQARSPGEFAGPSSGAAGAPRRLPAWTEAEIATLAQYEPLLDRLTGPGASVEAYGIPFDMNYVGQRYATARRQLTDTYACLVLSGAGSCAVDMPMLAAAPKPLAIIDLAGDAGQARLAQAVGADYVALPAEYLDRNDHVAVLARLILQVAPAELLVAPDPIVEYCLERHGRALATVTRLPSNSHVRASSEAAAP